MRLSMSGLITTTDISLAPPTSLIGEGRDAPRRTFLWSDDICYSPNYRFQIVSGSNLPVIPTLEGTPATAVVDIYFSEDPDGYVSRPRGNWESIPTENLGYRFWHHVNTVTSTGSDRIDSIINTIKIVFVS